MWKLTNFIDSILKRPNLSVNVRSIIQSTFDGEIKTCTDSRASPEYRIKFSTTKNLHNILVDV